MGSDLQKQSTKHLNVSLKNRMGTESHEGEEGLLEDREDEEDEITATSSDSERRAASVPAAGGGGAGFSVEEWMRLHPGSAGGGRV